MIQAQVCAPQPDPDLGTCHRCLCSMRGAACAASHEYPSCECEPPPGVLTQAAARGVGRRLVVMGGGASGEGKGRDRKYLY